MKFCLKVSVWDKPWRQHKTRDCLTYLIHTLTFKVSVLVLYVTLPSAPIHMLWFLTQDGFSAQGLGSKKKGGFILL